MKWTDLLYKKIEELEQDKVKAEKKLEKELAKSFNIGRKTESMSEIEGIQKSINVLYQCLGRSSEVTE